jgi:demethoxyubiquinone hydroxylase (CLK1/Coq7/Cat5 family)
MQTQTQKNDTVAALNELLRGEMAAVETYAQALKAMREMPSPELERARTSHEERVAAIRERILLIGGTPSDGSGLWGAFARLVQGGADLLGPKTAIAALEEGEDHMLKEYRESLGKVDEDTRFFIESRLMPGQERTHETMSNVKHNLH